MDLRHSLNAVSDVVANRPHPLREFDQIYMKTADMLIQAEHISRWLQDRDVVFIGDGDALALTLIHLQGAGQIAQGPKSVKVLDFDERVVNSVNRFAERFGYTERITATLYNVADPLPSEFCGRFGAFYTNPPFGGSNGGVSVRAFLRRGVEATGPSSVCCAVLADDMELPWCGEVLQSAQKFLLESGFVLVEIVPHMHTYHLDDRPELTSCSLVAQHLSRTEKARAESLALTDEDLNNFYGRESRMAIRYIRDLTNGGKLASRDHKAEPFTKSMVSNEK